MRRMARRRNSDSTPIPSSARMNEASVGLDAKHDFLPR
jgi:hypothetical protein